MKREDIIIIGGGGHAKVVIDAIKRSKKFNIYGITERNPVPGAYILGTKVIGTDDMLPALFKGGIKNAFIGIGSIGDCGIRNKIYENLKSIGFKIPVIIHPKAVVAEDVELGDGTFVAAGAIINTGTKIGVNAIVNTSASVDHDCTIGDFVHIAPGAVLSGGVKVGDETHIGTGAKITQYVTIGKCCILGAGLTQRHDMSDCDRNFGSGVQTGAYDKL